MKTYIKKTKEIFQYTIIGTFLICNSYLQSQNSSEYADQNTLPGYEVSGFGFDAAFNGGAFDAAMGYRALYSNILGVHNTALGSEALYNSNSNDNVACGFQSLYSNTSGDNNTAIGSQALQNNSSGVNNTAFGYLSAANVATADFMTAIGTGADFGTGFGQNQTSIGYNAISNAANRVEVGDANTTVFEAAVGLTVISDERFKTDVVDNVPGLEFIMGLRPVLFNIDTRKLTEFKTKNFKYQERYITRDFTKSSAILHSGFIAQEVEAAAVRCGFVFDGISLPQNESDTYGLAYSQFVVPLVKAVQEQDIMISQYRRTVAENKAKNSFLNSKQEFLVADRLVGKIELNITLEDDVFVFDYIISCTTSEYTLTGFDISGKPILIQKLDSGNSVFSTKFNNIKSLKHICLLIDNQVAAVYKLN